MSITEEVRRAYAGEGDPGALIRAFRASTVYVERIDPLALPLVELDGLNWIKAFTEPDMLEPGTDYLAVTGNDCWTRTCPLSRGTPDGGSSATHEVTGGGWTMSIWGELPQWTKDGEFPPVERTIPVYGKDPEGGEDRLWVCRAVWQAVTTAEIRMRVHGPFGTRDASGTLGVRRVAEDPDGTGAAGRAGEPEAAVACADERRSARRLPRGHIVSRFPGDRAEVLTPGQPVTESVDVLAEAAPDELRQLGGTVQQMSDCLEFMRALDPAFAGDVTGL